MILLILLVGVVWSADEKKILEEGIKGIMDSNGVEGKAASVVECLD